LYENNNIPTEEQRQPLMELMVDLLVRWPNITRIAGHGELMATACPGQHFQEILSSYSNEAFRLAEIIGR
jgi:N-acetyl-anhydromuramyl-L-alanine amidase AmpD